jgi:hypothetical protein
VRCDPFLGSHEFATRVTGPHQMARAVIWRQIELFSASEVNSEAGPRAQVQTTWAFAPRNPGFS